MSLFPEQTLARWFPIALSERVRARPRRERFFGIPLVLGRMHDGRAFAMEDRCPHRGVPLSAGKSGPAGLECAYHGWTFGGDGRCLRMPGAAEGQPLADVRVPALQVREHGGVVWVSQSADAPLPDRVTAMNPADRRFLWQSVWQGPIVDVLENFLDPLHTHLIHPGLVRKAHARAPVTATLKVAGDGFHVDYVGNEVQSGWLFKLFESRRVLERAHLSGLGVAQLEYRYARGWSACITIHCAPETAVTTHVFATLHVQGRFAPAWLVRLLVWPFLRRVASQDKAVLSMQTAARPDFPNRREIVSPLDITRPYIEAAWSNTPTTLAAERVVVLQL
jgi:phenylpropionate dioxygenase-like ring-hydroxylating dioxygenase large terminal subunit